jgi:hypothetical protein
MIERHPKLVRAFAWPFQAAKNMWISTPQEQQPMLEEQEMQDRNLAAAPLQNSGGTSQANVSQL